MRLAALAYAYAAIVVAVAALLAIGTHGLDLDWLPEGPADGGWLGAVSVGLLLGAAVTLVRKSLIAGLLASLSGLAYVAANWDDDDLSMLLWTVAYGGLIYLAGRLESERRTAAKRAAIHQRIDEEIVETTFNG